MKKLLVILVLSLLAASAFAQAKFSWIDAKSDDTETLLPGVKPSLVKGDIITAGSSTVYPLSVLITENFKKDGFAGKVAIDSIGTGGGMERFGKGELDVANASRAIKTSEADTAAKSNNGKVVGFRVATDGLAVVVSKKNTFVTDLTVAELGLVYSTAEFWSDVRPTFPKKAIVRYSPGTDSGTFDYFVEHVFKKDKKPILAAKNLSLSEDDNVLVQGVEGSEYAIGYFGYAYFEENKAKLNALKIDGVAPSAETVNNATYVLSRPLFLYTTDSILKAKPQVAGFIAYYLSNVNRFVRKAGYFPAPAAELTKTKQLWLDTVKGQY